MTDDIRYQMRSRDAFIKKSPCLNTDTWVYCECKKKDEI